MINRKVFSATLALQIFTGALLGMLVAPNELDVAANTPSFTNQFTMSKIATYQAAAPNSNGGVAEIVTYNKDNKKFYLVNGAGNPPSLDIVKLTTTTGGVATLTKEKSVLIKDLVETNGFLFGDLTSVDVNTAIDRIFVSVQASTTNSNGKIVELDYDGNLIAQFESGVQPDMVVSTPNGRLVLTANEGEPRQQGVDPQGSITILDTQTDAVQHLLFDNPDLIDNAVHIRGASNGSGVVTGKGTKANAITDLEPEYITISADGKKAYVSMQENNAIATVDLESKQLTSIKGLGLKDHSLTANAIDAARDSQIKIENLPFYGIYNPDGVANLKIGNQTYLFTANEGDATDFTGRKNFSSVNNFKSSLQAGSAAATFLNGKTAYNTLEVATDWGTDSLYLFGARSFSVWNADTMSQVYDSGSEIERATAAFLPTYFNASNSNTTFDNRSARKGPEPESIEIGKIGERYYAFVGLERIGGVIVYDVTDPTAPFFVNYTNTRVFTPTDNMNTDTGPEGLEFIPGSISPTGWPLLLVANEVGGTVAVIQVQLHDDQTAPSTPSNLASGAITQNSFTLSWSAATDNIALQGYAIYRNGKYVAATNQTSYNVQGQSAGSSAAWTVKAFDRGRNFSADSQPLNVTMLADAVAPSVPQNAQSGSVSQTSVTLSWQASTDDQALQGYAIYRDGKYIGATKNTSYLVSSLQPNKSYVFTIKAYDAARNFSADSSNINVTTLADTTAPSAPTGVQLTNTTNTQISVSWQTSTDNVSVRGYVLYLNGKYIATTKNSSYTFTGLTANKAYQVTVRAMDTSLNFSNASDSLNAQTTN